jgi:BetI-type transcriptional repressor, C-terminal
LHTDRDSVSLLWLDAWQASRRRPALLAEVDRQMQLDLVRLTGLIDSGISTADFEVSDATTAAMQIMSLIDGLSVQAVVRGILDYSAVRAMVVTMTEQLLHVPAGRLYSPLSTREPDLAS